jgi:phosphoglycolate phosphatase-like HAD superfamily hydrolase
MRPFLSNLTGFAPELIIFDKGGTLIDFRVMWADWTIELARRLEAATGIRMAERLYDAIAFDPDSGWIDPVGPFVTEPMANLSGMVVGLLCEAGLTRPAAEKTIEAIWFAPDPVANARPLADLPALFRALRARGLKIAIATMDDRSPTEATLADLGMTDLVDALVCADDGLPLKPAPDMVWEVCRTIGVAPERAIVVGDAMMDLQMGQAAGVGMVVAVLTGVTPEDALVSRADVVLTSVAELI